MLPDVSKEVMSSVRDIIHRTIKLIKPEPDINVNSKPSDQILRSDSDEKISQVKRLIRSNTDYFKKKVDSKIVMESCQVKNTISKHFQ